MLLITITPTIATPSAHPLAGLVPVGAERQGGRHPEDHRKEMGELLEKLQPERLATYPLDLVGAEFFQAVLGLDRSQSLGTGVEAAQGVVNRQLVDLHRIKRSATIRSESRVNQ